MELELEMKMKMKKRARHCPSSPSLEKKMLNETSLSFDRLSDGVVHRTTATPSPTTGVSSVFDARSPLVGLLWFETISAGFV